MTSPPSEKDDSACSVSESGNSDESDTALFKPIMAVINFTELAATALRLRRQRIVAQAPKSSTDPGNSLTCDIQKPAEFGSSNLVYTLKFSDGIDWIARIPGNGVSSFDDVELKMFKNRILTTRMLRLATSIPIPEIFSYETGTDNPVNVPYTLEDFAKGKKLSDAWIDKDWSSEEKRTRTIRSIAKHMSELHRFEFDKIGCIDFDVDGTNFLKVAPMLTRCYDPKKFEPSFGYASESGPWHDTVSYLLDVCEKSQTSEDELDLRSGHRKLLYLAIDSIPKFLDHEQAFALGHSDLNYQNIFVNDDGDVTAIIDWDGVCIETRVSAFARYPSWITRDWDPVMYDYGDDEEGERKEDSPAQLLSYRQAYTASLAEMRLPEAKYSSNDTVLSPILEAIGIAASQQMNRPWILMWLLWWAFQGKPPFSLNRFSYEYRRGTADEMVDAAAEAFRMMWHSEELDCAAYQEQYVEFQKWIMSYPDSHLMKSEDGQS